METQAVLRANLEDVMLSQIRKSHEDKHCVIPLMAGGGSLGESSSQRPERGKRWEWKSMFHRDRVSVCGDEHVLRVDGGEGCTDAVNMFHSTELCA